MLLLILPFLIVWLLSVFIHLNHIRSASCRFLNILQRSICMCFTCTTVEYLWFFPISRWRNNLLCSGTKLVYHVPEQGFFTTFQYKTTGWPTHTVHFDLSPSFFVRFWHIIYQNARIDPPVITIERIRAISAQGCAHLSDLNDFFRGLISLWEVFRTTISFSLCCFFAEF